MWSFPPALAICALLALAPADAASAPPCGSMTLGVQTHFGQGWPLAEFALAREVGAGLIRDGIGWARSERTPGNHVLQRRDRAFLDRARAEGLPLVLVFGGANPLYDGGHTPHTAAGRAAFARFVAAVVDEYADALLAVEIGNEVNGAFVDGPAASDRVAAHAALVAAVRAELAPRHSGLPILGGAAHSVPVGWFRELGAAGALAAMDGVAVHPYRRHPEHLDRELARLAAAIAEFGPPLPVFATEFGLETDDPALAAPHLVKMAAIMAEAGVCAASWYALRDQPFYRNTGLFDAAGAPKPAGRAFAIVARELLPHGRPVRLGSDPLLHAYRFGDAGPVVAWGAGQAVTFGPGAVVRRSDGSAVAPPARLDGEPIIVTGGVVFGTTATVADSLYQHGGAPWSYLLRTPRGGERPLAWRDWRWTSFLGDPGFPALAVTPAGATPAGRDPADMASVVERFTAPADGRFLVSGDWSRPAADGDGTRLDMVRDGHVLWSRRLAPGDAAALRALPVPMGAGETLDFVLDPLGDARGDTVRRRITVTREEPS